MTRPFPTPDKLRQLLRYEPETGKLFWLERAREMFATNRAFKTWNTRFAGQEAFTSETYGYRVGNVDYKLCADHRVIWAMVHGYWPDEDLDHINGDRADNRIDNLREATRSENLCNRSMSPLNTSGHKGVFFHEQSQKWRAHIKKNGSARHLGCFDALADALSARRSAEIKLHGDFARAA